MTETHSSHCAAFGCPMWGSVRSAGSPDWFCGLHAVSMPIHWQAITAKLNQDRERIQQIHYAMQNGGDWRATLDDVYRRAEGA